MVLLSIAIGVALLTGQDKPWRDNASSPRIESLRKQIEDGNPSALSVFWQEMKSRGAPLIETLSGDPGHVLVTFLYRAQAPTKNVVLHNQLTTSRDPGVNVLTRLLDTDVWYKTYWMRNDMRLSYSFIPNATEESLGNKPEFRIQDPLNNKYLPVDTGLGRSILELPAAPPQVWIVPRPKVPSGKLEEEQIESKVLKIERTAWIYTPAGYDPKRPVPYRLLVCFDGAVYSSPNHVPTPTILDNLIAQRKIPPMILVLIAQSPQPGRNIELSNNQRFLDFVADELLPHVRAKWHATSDPAKTVVCGSSAGGLASTFFAFRRSDVFGNVLSQSGAFWPGKERDNPEHEWLTRQFESSRRLPIRFVLQVGVLENVATPLGGPSILTCNRRLRDILTAKGYELHYSEIAGGHEPISWRGGIGDGLIQLMGNDGK